MHRGWSLLRVFTWFCCKKSGYFTKPVKNITNRIFICHKQVNKDTKSNSYSLKRQQNYFCNRTKNANIRYFYALISFLLKNIWLYLQKKHFTIVKRGPQVIDEDKFRFDMFVLLIEEWLRRKLRARLMVECLR